MEPPSCLLTPRPKWEGGGLGPCCQGLESKIEGGFAEQLENEGLESMGSGNSTRQRDGQEEEADPCGPGDQLLCHGNKAPALITLEEA